MIVPKRPLPARLFRPIRPQALLRPFLWIVSGYCVCAAVILFFQNTCPPSRLVVEQGSILPFDLPAVGVDPEPAATEVPSFAPFEPFPAYVPWQGLPGWKEAQAYLPAYREWLEEQNPGYEVEVVQAMVTAYTPHVASCGDSADGWTATMNDAWQRGIAVPKTLLWRWRANGTKVHVPGYLWQSHPAEAWKPDDCGGALLRTWRHGLLHIDVRFQNEGWAKQWGVRRGWVMLLTPRKDKR